jgi:hypothetical protein
VSGCEARDREGRRQPRDPQRPGAGPDPTPYIPVNHSCGVHGGEGTDHRLADTHRLSEDKRASGDESAERGAGDKFQSRVRSVQNVSVVEYLHQSRTSDHAAPRQAKARPAQQRLLVPDSATVAVVRDALDPGAVKSRRTASGPDEPEAPTRPRHARALRLRLFPRKRRTHPRTFSPAGTTRAAASSPSPATSTSAPPRTSLPAPPLSSEQPGARSAWTYPASRSSTARDCEP